ncbi:hypothetical protein [Salegentibacter salarius]|uniref:Uncharacterized protein n=1 Tax=Salegentibacter salarius TaxID=435906 RepID=A0A2N0TZF8_9FLAO|nr:hypothetical protein [Salegentibacter salarius]OEY73289.1 hypothetical protein BHS39_09760 [Salegentibacter salarius]PKD20109.1 hypothetical protein APR40_09740 [Salegentibacter salarius]SLJ97848.1 hypothetical protein SAMN05660445_02040 [Salegentibacter salarius]
MNLQEEKISLAQLLMETNDPELIRSIREILSERKPSDFWNELSSEEKAEIEEADKEIAREETTSYENFIKKHR